MERLHRTVDFNQELPGGGGWGGGWGVLSPRSPLSPHTTTTYPSQATPQDSPAVPARPRGASGGGGVGSRSGGGAARGAQGGGAGGSGGGAASSIREVAAAAAAAAVDTAARLSAAELAPADVYER